MIKPIKFQEFRLFLRKRDQENKVFIFIDNQRFQVVDIVKRYTFPFYKKYSFEKEKNEEENSFAICTLIYDDVQKDTCYDKSIKDFKILNDKKLDSQIVYIHRKDIERSVGIEELKPIYFYNITKKYNHIEIVTYTFSNTKEGETAELPKRKNHFYTFLEDHRHNFYNCIMEIINTTLNTKIDYHYHSYGFRYTRFFLGSSTNRVIKYNYLIKEKEILSTNLDTLFSSLINAIKNTDNDDQLTVTRIIYEHFISFLYSIIENSKSENEQILVTMMQLINGNDNPYRIPKFKLNQSDLENLEELYKEEDLWN